MAAAAIDKPTIVNWALADIGQAPNFSLDSQTSMAGQIAQVWPRAVDFAFSLADWPFARRTTKLAAKSDAGDIGWAYAFTLPSDALGAPLLVLQAVDPREVPLRRYTIEAGTLYADVADVWARCKIEADPSVWPADFRAAFVTLLASMLAVPLNQDVNLAANLRQQAIGSPSQGGAGGMFGRVIAQMKAGEPVTTTAMVDPLTAAHGGGAHHHGLWHGCF